MKKSNNKDLNSLKITSLDVFKTKKEKKLPKNNNYGVILSHPYRSYIVGKTGQGKSNLCISCLLKDNMLRNFFNEIHIFSPNVFFENDFKLIEKYNKDCKVNMYDTTEKFSEVIDNIKASQKALHQKRGEKMENILIYIDDTLGDKKFLKSKALISCYCEMRKYNTSCWLLSQLYRGCPPVVRTQSESIIIFNQPRREVNKIVEELSWGKFDKKFFYEIFNNLAKVPFSFIHINRKTGKMYWNFENEISPI